MAEKRKSMPKTAPARTPEARENQMIALAMDLAEKQLRDGTASSQIISLFLKAGTVQNQLELEQLRRKNDLLEAQKASIDANESTRVQLDVVLNAIRGYRGEDVDLEDDYDY